MSVKDTSCALETITARISASASLSDTVNLYGLRLFSVIIPSDWTTANLTFQVSVDEGTTWSNLKDQNGNEITAVANAADCVVVDPTQFASFQYLRLRSGTNAAPIAQALSRSLQLIIRSV